MALIEIDSDKYFYDKNIRSDQQSKMTLKSHVKALPRKNGTRPRCESNKHFLKILRGADIK